MKWETPSAVCWFVRCAGFSLVLVYVVKEFGDSYHWYQQRQSRQYRVRWAIKIRVFSLQYSYFLFEPAYFGFKLYFQHLLLTL
jgi:hypothetical protein